MIEMMKQACWLTAILCVGTACLRAQQPANVRGDRVREERLQDRRFVTGEIRATRRSRVAVREPGLVAHMLIREGQRVEEGSVIAQIDDRRLQLEKLQLAANHAVVEATLSEYRADLAFAKWQLAAYRKLEQRGSSFEREVREAQAAIEVAQAKVVQQDRQLDVLAARDALLDQRLYDMIIVAPFTGICVVRHVEKGEWVAAGSAVADLVATDVMEAWFDLSEELASALESESVAIELHCDAVGLTRHVKTFRVVPELSSETRSFPLVIPIVNEGEKLKARMSATAWVPIGAEKKHLTISKDAIMRSETGVFVYAARGPQPSGLHLAAAVPVFPLFEHGDRVVIRGGSLNAKDLVVVEGNERLYPNTPLAVQVASSEPKREH